MRPTRVACASVAALTAGPLFRSATARDTIGQKGLPVTCEEPITVGAHSQRLLNPIAGCSKYMGVAACTKVTSLCLVAAVTLRVLARRRSAASQASRLERNYSKCDEAKVAVSCEFLRMYSEDVGVSANEEVVRRLSSVSQGSEVEGMYDSLSAEFHPLFGHRRSDKQGAVEAELKKTCVLVNWKTPTADSLESFPVSEASTEMSFPGTRQCSVDVYSEDWSAIGDSRRSSRSASDCHDKPASGCISHVLGKILFCPEDYEESAARGA